MKNYLTCALMLSVLVFSGCAWHSRFETPLSGYDKTRDQNQEGAVVYDYERIETDFRSKKEIVVAKFKPFQGATFTTSRIVQIDLIIRRISDLDYEARIEHPGSPLESMGPAVVLGYEF